jgi:hypothetical protein
LVSAIHDLLGSLSGLFGIDPALLEILFDTLAEVPYPSAML